jgi:hypothetical protein
MRRRPHGHEDHLVQLELLKRLLRRHEMGYVDGVERAPHHPKTKLGPVTQTEYRVVTIQQPLRA